MSKEIIKTSSAPLPAGAYSQAVKAGGFIFVSGQIPIEASTGKLYAEGIHKETRIVLDNIAAILEAAGSNTAKIVKFTVYLKKIDDVKFVNEVLMERFIESTMPARSTVEVSRLPKDVSVEIDAIAAE